MKVILTEEGREEKGRNRVGGQRQIKSSKYSNKWESESTRQTSRSRDKDRDWGQRSKKRRTWRKRSFQRLSVSPLTLNLVCLSLCGLKKLRWIWPNVAKIKEDWQLPWEHIHRNICCEWVNWKKEEDLSGFLVTADVKNSLQICISKSRQTCKMRWWK